MHQVVVNVVYYQKLNFSIVCMCCCMLLLVWALLFLHGSKSFGALGNPERTPWDWIAKGKFKNQTKLYSSSTIESLSFSTTTYSASFSNKKYYKKLTLKRYYSVAERSSPYLFGYTIYFYTVDAFCLLILNFESWWLIQFGDCVWSVIPGC